jgi:hypothetical protein
LRGREDEEMDAIANAMRRAYTNLVGGFRHFVERKTIEAVVIGSILCCPVTATDAA